MTSGTDVQLAEPECSGNGSAMVRTGATVQKLDNATAQKIMDTIKVSKKFIEEEELAKQCREVIAFYLAEGNHKGVIDACSLIDRASLTAGDNYVLATSLISSGFPEKARNVISTSNWKGHEDSMLTALGKLLVSQGRTLDAKAHFEEALRINAQNREALGELNTRWPEDDFAIKARGEALRLEGKPEEASQAFKKLLDKGDNSPELLKSAGIAMADMRMFGEAEELLKKAADEGLDAEAQLALGIVQLERDELDSGILNVEEGIRRGAGKSTEVAKKLATAYAATGEIRKTVEIAGWLMNDALQGKELKDFSYLLLDVSRKYGNSEVALYTLEKIIAVEGISNSLLDLEFSALSELGRYDDAMALIDKHKEMASYNQRMLSLLRKTGKMKEAESLADEMLKKDEEDTEAIFTKLLAVRGREGAIISIWNFQRTVFRLGNKKLLRLYLEVAKECSQDLVVVKTAQKLISLGESSTGIMGDRATALERLGRIQQSGKCLRKLYRKEKSTATLELLTTYYARHGKLAEEEDVLTDAHTSMQLPVGLLERLAKLKMDRGEQTEALNIIASAMEGKETPEGRYLQAEMMLKSGKPEEARRAVQRAMQLGYPGKIAEFLAGSAEEAMGNSEAALERYGRSVDCGMNTPDVFLSRIRVLRSMGKVSDAKEEIQSVEKLFASDDHVLNECIEFYFSSGLHQQCIDAAERMVKKNRSSETAWRRRGLSLLALKRYDEAITSLEAALKLDRNSETVNGLKEAYDAKGDRKSIIRTIDLLLEVRGTDRKLLLEKGDVLAESGRHEEALSTYQTAADRFGLDEDTVIRKAGILHGQKKYADELEILLEFSKKGEKSAVVHSMISGAYLGMKRYSDALEYADSAMQLEPDNFKHLDQRASILYSLGRYDEAERSVEIALSISPKDPDALELKGNILMKQARHSQALELFNGALAAGICNSQIYRNRGDCLLGLERYSEALDSYTKALKDSPSSTESLLGKGICELHMEKYSSATLSLNELTKKDPENGRGWYYFGMALKRQKLPSEAKRAFSQAVKLDDTLDRAWFELAELQLNLGELNEAELAYEKSLEYAPNNSDTIEGLANCRIAKKKDRAEKNAISLLKLEYDLNRNPTKEEAFSVCKIPMDEIDISFDLLNEPTTLTVPTCGDGGWKDVEERSASVLAKCFRNKDTAIYGVRLCDIVANFPSLTLDEAKQIFEYIAKVQNLSVIDAMDDDRFERLMKKATRLKQGDRSLIGIIVNLGVGIYTAKLIEGSLASMGKSGYTTDFVSFSGEKEESRPQDSTYDPYSARRELYEQFYGQQTNGDQDADVEEREERCLYHGGEAIGACSSCQTNLCNDCVSGADGHCPNCGVVLMSDESGSNPAY